MKILISLLLSWSLPTALHACPACGISHLVLVGKADGKTESAAWDKLKSDLSSRFKVFPVDFDGNDEAAIAELPTAKLLVLGFTPAEWPADLVGGVRSYLDRGFPLLVLDDQFKGKSAAGGDAGDLWQKLELALGCSDTAPAPDALFKTAGEPARHATMSGVAAEAMSALSPAAPPCHLLYTIASDAKGTPLAWMSAYQSPPPADRLGNVAVVPLSSPAMLASADVRRLVVQSTLAATDSEDLIPAAGLPVAP